MQCFMVIWLGKIVDFVREEDQPLLVVQSDQESGQLFKKKIKMIDCCELALYNSRLVLYVTLGAFGVIAFLLAMFLPGMTGSLK